MSDSGMREAIHLQQSALSQLSRARSNTGSWDDSTRQSLDHQVLDPLEADGKRLLERMRTTAAELARLNHRLVR